jgi:hypothetical protein
MASETRSVGTGANDNSVGANAWGTTSNITASDDSYSTCTFNSVDTAQRLKATNFGYTLSGVVIDGILVEVERKVDTGTNITDSQIAIIKADGTISSTNMSAGATWPTTEAYASFGGSTSLWGETWTTTDINDADFGVAIRPASDFAVNRTASVDHVRMTVYYHTAYTMAVAHASFTCTGQTVVVGRLLTITVAYTTFALTGYAATFTWDRLWTNATKNTSTFTNGTPNSSSWTNATKTSTTFTNSSKS